jgi:hypothetical protein
MSPGAASKGAWGQEGASGGPVRDIGPARWPALVAIAPPGCDHAGSRRVPVNEAYNSEAAQLQDAELDLRCQGKFDRVFGNATFEDEASASPKTPGAIKMNNLFEDPSTVNRNSTPDSGARSRRRSQERDNTPDKASARGQSMSRFHAGPQ